MRGRSLRPLVVEVRCTRQSPLMRGRSLGPLVVKVRVERDRVSHPLLKFKVRVMEEVFIGFFESGLVCHMVHALVSVEIPLGHQFRHSL